MINLNVTLNPEDICKYCHEKADFYYEGTVGRTAFRWGCVLFLSTGCCCCIPCLIDECMDQRVICKKCKRLNRIERSRW